MDHSNLGKLVEGVWLPKHEQHLTDWMTTSKGAHRINGVITYQWSKQKAAMALMKQYIPEYAYKQFVDVGAHVGLWSMWWVKEMAGVTAFEPIPDMQTLYHANMAFTKKYRLIGKALSHQKGFVELAFNPENTGNTHAKHGKDRGLQLIQADMSTLDEEFFSMSSAPRIGALKIDCEGLEELVVKGGETIIKHERPLIIVEQKKGAEYYGNDPKGAVTLLESWGYKVCKHISGDYIMLHKDLL